MVARTYRPIDESIRNGRAGTGTTEQPDVDGVPGSRGSRFLLAVVAALRITENLHEIGHICIQVLTIGFEINRQSPVNHAPIFAISGIFARWN
jgi:hypothetical protein